jgi:hypothetical protein
MNADDAPESHGPEETADGRRVGCKRLLGIHIQVSINNLSSDTKHAIDRFIRKLSKRGIKTFDSTIRPYMFQN